jgi:peroxiredoxin
MPIAAGDRLPDVKFFVIGEAGPKPLTTSEVFGGKTSVIIGVPGATRPTCRAS